MDLGVCEYAIRNKSGLAVVYGDVGTGKTTILNKLRERFGDEGFTIAVMNNPNQTSDTALLKAIAAEFGLKPPRTLIALFRSSTLPTLFWRRWTKRPWRG